MLRIINERILIVLDCGFVEKIFLTSHYAVITERLVMSDYKKTRKNKGKKSNNIVPLKKDLKVISNDNPVDAKQVEIDRLNDHVREAFKKLAEFADGCKLNNSEMWYNILYFAKQRAIHTIPYAEFKINDEGTSSEVTENYVKFYNEHYPELFNNKEINRKLH